MKLERVSLLLAVGIGSLAAWAQSAPDDPSVAARASLERIQALRKERPGDGVLVFYQALVHVSLGERDVGFDSVWDDPEFQKIFEALADEEPQTPASPVAFRLKDPRLIPEGIAYD